MNQTALQHRVSWPFRAPVVAPAGFESAQQLVSVSKKLRVPPLKVRVSWRSSTDFLFFHPSNRLPE